LTISTLLNGHGRKLNFVNALGVYEKLIARQGSGPACQSFGGTTPHTRRVTLGHLPFWQTHIATNRASALT
jgi:hypothetical protein